MGMADEQKSGIDMFLCSGWPAGIERDISEPSFRPPVLPEEIPGQSAWEAACAGPLGDLVLSLEPRYCVFGTADVFYQRPPFQVPKRGHACRCIGLGAVGSVGKQKKWIHALGLAPMQHMRREELKQAPPNCTSNPFTHGEKRPAPD